MLFSHFFPLPQQQLFFILFTLFPSQSLFTVFFYNPFIPVSKYNAEFFSLLIYSKSSSVVFGNTINRAKGIFRYTCSNLYNVCNGLNSRSFITFIKSSINNLIIPNRTLQWQSSLLNTQSVYGQRGRLLMARSVCLERKTQHD